MASSSPWVRPLVWIVALGVMALPLVGSTPDGRRDAPRQAILDLIEGQQRAWNDGDVVGFLGAYAQGADVVFASGDGVTEGWSRILQQYRATYPGPGAMGHLTLNVLRVDLLGRDHARALGEWTLEGGSEAGRGVFTLILEQRQQRWWILHDHTSRARS